MKTINWKEAVKEMRKGKKIKKKSWHNGDYLYLADGTLYCDGGFDYLDMLHTQGKWEVVK